MAEYAVRTEPDPADAGPELPAVGEGEVRMVTGAAGDVPLTGEDRIEEEQATQLDSIRDERVVRRIGRRRQGLQPEAGAEVLSGRDDGVGIARGNCRPDHAEQAPDPGVEPTRR